MSSPVFPNCLCWLPSCFSTRTRVNLYVYVTRLYTETLKFTVATYKHCVFSKSCICIPYAFRSLAWEPSNQSFPFIFCCTITHWYSDFQSYLDSHKMHKGPGFCSMGRKWSSYKYQNLLKVATSGMKHSHLSHSLQFGVNISKLWQC